MGDNMTEEEKIEKLKRKIEKKQKMNQFLTDFNDVLGESNTNKTKYGFWGSENEENIEGYEQYQLEEEEQELEDDDLYEKGED